MTTQRHKKTENVTTTKESAPTGSNWLKVGMAVLIGLGAGIPLGGLGWKMLQAREERPQNLTSQPPQPPVTSPPAETTVEPPKTADAPNAVLEEMQKAKIAQDAEIVALKNSNAAATNDLDALRKQMTELNAASVRLTEQVADLELKNTNATKLLEKEQEEVSKVQLLYRESIAKLNVAEDEKKKTNDAAKADQQKIGKLQSDLNLLNIEFKKIQDSNASLSQQLLSLSPNDRVETAL